MKTNERQEQLLINIVDLFIKTGEPISSGMIENEGLNLNLSSATIRKEMIELETFGFLEKSNSQFLRTSGRIPTNKAYKFYLENMKENPDSFINIKLKLDEVLNDRKKNIDEILNESINIINESTNSLVISKDIDDDLRLIDLNLYKVDSNKVNVVIVCSNGMVNNRMINIEEGKIDEYLIALSAIKKRMINHPLNTMADDSLLIKEIFSKNLHIIEEEFQDFIRNIFSNISMSKTQYSGMNSLVTSKTLNKNEEIKKIFELIENNSIWEMLNNSNKANLINSKSATIDLETIDGASIINKEIKVKNKHRMLTIVGAKAQNYEKLFSILDYIEEAVKEEDEN